MFKKILKSELGKGVLILFFVMNLYNFLNFVFHFSMGRLLSPTDYGILAVLMSLVYIYGVPAEAIQNIISKYTSKFNLKNENGKIKFLMHKSLKRGFKIFFLVFILASLISIWLSKFLEINLFLILLTNLFIFASFSIPITRGVLQGRKKFGKLGISLVVESIFKLSLAIILVVMGFKVVGAMAGVLLGIFIAFIVSFYLNKDVLKVQKNEVNFNHIYGKSVPYFATMIVIIFALSIDIILAKKFFAPDMAGNYAVISMLGKMIFFGTMAIGKAMFPLTSEREGRKKESDRIFKKSFSVIFLICIFTISIFAFFPKVVIGILYGSRYVHMFPYLVYSGISLSILALSNLVLVYGLSINRVKKSGYLFIFLIIEIILLFLYHHTMMEYLMALIASNTIIFIGSLFLVKISKSG